MKSVIAVVLLGLAAVALADDKYPEETYHKGAHPGYQAGPYYGQYGGYPYGGYYGGFPGYYGGYPYFGYPYGGYAFGGYPHGHGYRLPYNGAFGDKCGADGFYVRDAKSIVICSNGNAYPQPCPYGTANGKSLSNGHYYAYSELCGVNLNDGNKHPAY